MTDNTSERYSVGYGRPPLHSRFKKGQSGNPRGRPKGCKNLSTRLNEILNKKVPVREGGRSRKLTKIEIALEVNLNKAAAGDTRAFSKIIDLIPKLGGFELLAEPAPAASASDARARLAELFEREIRNLGVDD